MFLIPWLMENCGKNEKKFPNQSGDVMPTSIYFTNYENCCSQLFYRKFLKIPRTHPWQRTTLVELMSRYLYRA